MQKYHIAYCESGVLRMGRTFLFAYYDYVDSGELSNGALDKFLQREEFKKIAKNGSCLCGNHKFGLAFLF